MFHPGHPNVLHLTCALSSPRSPSQPFPSPFLLSSSSSQPLPPASSSFLPPRRFPLFPVPLDLLLNFFLPPSSPRPPPQPILPPLAFAFIHSSSSHLPALQPIPPASRILPSLLLNLFLPPLPSLALGHRGLCTRGQARYVRRLTLPSFRQGGLHPRERDHGGFVSGV